MNHYVPKRRIPVTAWSSELPGLAGSVFLDLDPAGNQHQTVLEKLNESTRFLPLAVGPDGRIQLVNKARLLRVSVGRSVVPGDIFARGFRPWREEAAEFLLGDGTQLSGRIWMPLERDTQRVSDFINREGSGFMAVLTPVAVHLVNASAVVRIQVEEAAGGRIGERPGEALAA